MADGMRLKNYESTIHQAPFGFAFHEILLDSDGNPTDYRFHDVNPAYERLTGLRATDIIGKTANGIAKVADNPDMHRLDCYGRIALNGGDDSFEYFSTPMNRWYRVSVFSGEMGFFNTVYNEITSGRQNPDVSLDEVSINRRLDRCTSEMIDLQSVEEIYAYITNTLSADLADTMVLCVSVDVQQKQTRLEAMAGVEDSLFMKITRFTGFNPVGRFYNLRPQHQHYFESGHLVEFGGGLAEFAAGEFPDKACDIAEKFAGLHKIYTVGINKDNKTLAAIHFFTRKKKEITEYDYITSFVQRAGLVLQKKMAEESLTHSHNLLRYIVEHTRSAIAVHDRDLNYVYVSQRYLNDFDIREKDIIGKHHYEIFPDLPKKWKKVHLQALAGKVSYGDDDPYFRNDGRVFWTRWECRPWYEADGSIGGIIIYTEVINERRQFEEQIRKLSKAVQQSPVCIVITDLQATIEYVNQKFTEVTGYSHDEAIGQNPKILKSGMVPEETYRELWESLLAGKEWQGEFLNKKKNGEHYWEFATISPIRDSEGKITHYLAIKEDITERKKRENELKSHERFRELLIEISSLYINIPLHEVESSIRNTLELMGRFVGADRAYVFEMEADTGLCSNTYEWCNEGISPQIDNLQRIVIPDEFLIAFTRGERLIVENVDILHEGYLKEHLLPQDIKSLIVFPMMIENECIGFIGFDSVLNYYQYSEVEQQLLQVYCQMIVNIKKRKATEEELVRSKEIAEESNRLKSTFLANMSHEIRTPMNGILGFVELLKNIKLTSEERNNFISIVNKSGQRLMDTINDIIEMSKIEAGHVNLDMTVTCIEDVIQYHYEFFKLEAEEKGLDFRYAISPGDEDRTIITDSAKVEAILTNLIKNAIKFTTRGKIAFGCYFEGESVVFYVEDTGMGIPANRLDSIFEPFVQADLRIARNHEGSGLGLAIARAYTNRLGGKIWVKSQEGKGSTFNLSLPVIPAGEFTKSRVIDAEEHISIDAGMKILIAEDDDVSYLYLKTVLMEAGVKLIRATNGSEAVEAVRNDREISMVLMDIKMPGTNGLEATREIRKFNQDIPIIAQTGYTLSVDKKMAIEAGCNDYLAKPIRKHILLSAISRYSQVREA